MEVKYKGWTCDVHIGKFAAKPHSPVILLTDIRDGSPIAKCNVNLPGLKENQVAIDVNNCGNEMIDALKDANIIKSTPSTSIKSGFCVYPVYELDDVSKL